MVDAQAIKWVESKIHKGYDLEEMEDYLLLQGYSHQEARDAIQFVKEGKKISRSITKRPKALLIGIIICFLIIIAVGFFASQLQTLENDTMQSKQEQVQEKVYVAPILNKTTIQNNTTTPNETTQTHETQEQAIPVDSINKSFKSKLPQAEPNKLHLKINLKEQVLSINQTLEGGNYDMTYNGNKFYGLLIYSHSKDGLETKHFYVTKSWFENISFSEGRDNRMDININSFQETENEYKQGVPFNQEGTYIYSMTVFDCYDVENLLKKNACGASKVEDLPLQKIFSSLKPVAQDTAALIVI